MYDKILIPLDGSERAEAVLTRIGPLLDAANAELCLLSIVEIPEVEQGHMDVVGGAREAAEQYLARTAERLVGRTVHRHVAIGDPATEILAYAKAEKVDLIAMASHGYRGLARLFYGSVAERVLRASTVPVLVLRSFGASDDSTADEAVPVGDDPLELSNVLIPLDGSKDAERVLPDAVALAKATGATLHLVRVRPGFPATPFYAPSPELLADTAIEEEYLANVAAYLHEDGVSVETAVPIGAVSERLCAYMEDNAVDLLAMTTHGRTGFERWLLGSTAEEVLRRTPSPILVRRISA